MIYKISSTPHPENKKKDAGGDLAASICTVIGQKLSADEEFQGEVMAGAIQEGGK